jgi:hypothetical protein
MLWYVGLTLLYGTFDGLLTPESKDTRFPTPAYSMDERTVAAARDTLARRVRGAVDCAGPPGATLRARAR